MDTFANKVPRLPKYTDEEGDGKKWWTKQEGYDSNVNGTKSAKELNLKKKGHNVPFKQPEAMLIADHSNEPVSVELVDSFKAVHVKKPPKPTG